MNITKHWKSWTCWNSLEKSQVISKSERNKLNTSFRKNWKREMGKIDNTNSKMESWGVRKNKNSSNSFWKHGKWFGKHIGKKRQNSEVVKKRFDKKWKSFKTLLEMFFYSAKAKMEKKVKNSSNTLNFVVRKKTKKKVDTISTVCSQHVMITGVKCLTTSFANLW